MNKCDTCKWWDGVLGVKQEIGFCKWKPTEKVPFWLEIPRTVLESKDGINCPCYITKS